MPRVTIPDLSVCIHRDIHPKWINQQHTYAVCRMALPHLINSIKLLETTLNESYPLQIYSGSATPVRTEELKNTEYSLAILKAELDRRKWK